MCKGCGRADMAAMVAARSLDTNPNTLPLSAALCRRLSAATSLFKLAATHVLLWPFALATRSLIVPADGTVNVFEVLHRAGCQFRQQTARSPSNTPFRQDLACACITTPCSALPHLDVRRMLHEPEMMPHVVLVHADISTSITAKQFIMCEGPAVSIAVRAWANGGRLTVL